MPTIKQLLGEFEILLGRSDHALGPNTGAMYVLGSQLRKRGATSPPFSFGRDARPSDATAILLASLCGKAMYCKQVIALWRSFPLANKLPKNVSSHFANLPILAPLTADKLTLGAALDTVFEIAASRNFLEQMRALNTPGIAAVGDSLPRAMATGQIGFSFSLNPARHEAQITLRSGFEPGDTLAYFYFAPKDRPIDPQCTITEIKLASPALFYLIAKLINWVPPPRERAGGIVRPLGDILAESVRLRETPT